MKNILLIISILAMGSLKAQKTQEAEFQVNGVCNMCKNRIEDALDTKGIRFAEWNVSTQMLFVAFKPNKITLEQIHQIIAEAGHDTQLVKAKDEVYEAIHGCCKYRENGEHQPNTPCEHEKK